MTGREQEYRWYLIGCNRLGHTPLSEEDFVRQWQEYEDHAEKLKAAEAGGSLPALDAQERARMQQRIQADPLFKAVLVGQAEPDSVR